MQGLRRQTRSARRGAHVVTLSGKACVKILRQHAATISCALALTTAPALAADVHYSCDGGTHVTAAFSAPGASPGSVVLVFAGSPDKLTLPQVKSADGGRYANADVEFWIRGRDATLTRVGRSEACRSK
ncbi:MAG: MliC family protein [Xanthobacteraceae bacterium]|nr:MliC family protein [Xanthobacteraceae bacterium]